MKIILPSSTLSFIGLLSNFSYYISKNILNFISIETQISNMMFFTILVFIDNLSLVYDLQNIKPIIKL